MVVVSAGHVCGTHGSCIVSSAADVLEMSVVRGMREMFGLRWCGRCRWGVGRGLGHESGRWDGVMTV